MLKNFVYQDQKQGKGKIIYQYTGITIQNFNLGRYIVGCTVGKDHWRFGPYTPIFLIPRMLLLSF